MNHIKKRVLFILMCALVYGQPIRTQMSVPSNIDSSIYAQKSVVNVIPLERQIGKKHSGDIKALVENSKPLTIDAWNRYVTNVQFGDIHYKSTARYNNKGIFVDIEGDAKKVGKSRYPYAETMHEMGHHVDSSIARDKLKSDQCNASNMYISKKYSCTLDEMFKTEANRYFAKIRKNTSSDKIAWMQIKKELQKYSAKDSNEVSDIWDGATNGKVYGYCAHSIMDKDYWNKVSVGNEGFAEIFEAEIVNPKGLLLIKKYFPKSYAIYKSKRKSPRF